jgi:hypothetical protein
MSTALTLSSYLLDMLIVTIFLYGCLNRKNTRIKKAYFVALLAVEIILLCNEIILENYMKAYSNFITIFLSLITTIFLAAFFDSSIKTKIVYSVLFQFLVFIGEVSFTFIVSKVNASFMYNTDISLLYAVMNGGSKITLMILCIIVTILHRKKNNIMNWDFDLILLTTPLITLCIYIIIPIKKFYVDDDLNFYKIIFVCLAFLNIANFLLIVRNKDYSLTAIKNAQLESQIRYQDEKYSQLSESYRQNRRIIHDTKNHYFTIQRYIEENKLDELVEYAHSAVDELESTYAKYNTGNLVIDSLITNIDSRCCTKHINFTAHLNVNYHRIPVTDYELCTILGNILDNAVNACSKCEADRKEIFIMIDNTDDSKFIIHMENSYPNKKAQTAKEASLNKIFNKAEASLNHGYGLLNVQSTVDKYHGFLVCQEEEFYITDILIPCKAEL